MLIRSMENIHSNDCQCLLTGTSVIGEHLILRGPPCQRQYLFWVQWNRLASPVLAKFLYIVPPRLLATAEPSKDWRCCCLVAG